MLKINGMFRPCGLEPVRLPGMYETPFYSRNGREIWLDPIPADLRGYFAITKVRGDLLLHHIPTGAALAYVDFSFAYQLIDFLNENPVFKHSDPNEFLVKLRKKIFLFGEMSGNFVRSFHKDFY